MKRLLATVFLMSLVAPGLAHAQTPAARPSPPIASPGATAAMAKPGRVPVATPVDAGGLVDINSADARALDALPGVGPARAKAIIAGRPFAEKNELLSRKIVPADVFAKIEGMIALVNVNTASVGDMAKILPNVGPVRAAAIVKNRPYGSVQDLVAKGALTQGVLDGIKPLLTTK